MPKVRTNDILNDLRDLSLSANSLTQQTVSESQNNLLDDWFALVKAAALQIVAAPKNKNESDSLVEEFRSKKIPILSYLKPESDNRKDDSKVFPTDASRAHIHKAKQNAVSVDKLSNDAKHSEISKSTDDVHIIDAISEESSHEIPCSEASKMSPSRDIIQESRMVSVVNSTVIIEAASMDKSEGTYLRARKSNPKNNSETIAAKASTANDTEENLPLTTPEQKKPSVKYTNNLKAENIYTQTPKVSRDLTKQSYLTQVIEKKFSSVCSGILDSNKVEDQISSCDRSCKKNGKKETQKNLLRKEVAERNFATKGTKISKEETTNHVASSLLALQRSVVPQNGKTISLLASQKNAFQAVIQPPKSLLLKNSAQVQSIKKEEERLMEMKMKEEKANTNLQKVLTLRQKKLEENKRKRQEKLDHAMEKRQKLEQEKVLLLKNKYEGLSNSAKPTKNSEKRKRVESVDDANENKYKAKREKEDITNKNNKVYKGTPTELNGAKVVQKVENRSNELTGKYSKQTPNAVNETVVIHPKTPSSGPLKSILPENVTRTPANTSKGEITSYEMTPIQDNYNSDDSLDESSKDHSKKIPSWAQGIGLKTALINQHYNRINPEEIFGSVLESPILSKIFGQQKKHYLKRSSSALWHSSLVKIV